LRAEVLHRCTPALPIVKPDAIREVVTLHDLAILRHPERFRRWHRHAQQRRMPLLRRAARIICDSRFTADEAMTLLGLPAERLEVIYLGQGLEPLRADDAPVPATGSLPERFFLFVGSLEPGKNLELLKRAYAAADNQGAELPPLVIVGIRWLGVSREGRPDRRWHYLGYQPDAVLAALYRRALALLFPSRYEGFGLPVLEAMAAGCPVVCSRMASLPEVGGDAPFYVEQTATAYLAAMLEIARDDRTRQDLSRRGLAQAARFSWRLCAEQTTAVYRAVLQ
jgi:alpha-1,3-rhamnosyl/mannosyltransferase